MSKEMRMRKMREDNFPHLNENFSLVLFALDRDICLFSLQSLHRKKKEEKLMALVVRSECKEMTMKRGKERRENYGKWKIFFSHELQKAMNVVFPTLFCSQSFPSNDHERMCCRGNFKLCNQNFDKDFISEEKLYRKVKCGNRNLAKK